MPRLKRGSSILDYSEKRLTVLQTINIPENDAELNLGNIQSSIDQTRAKLNQYNAALSVADQLNDEVQEMERSLVKLHDRMLSAIAAKYGRDSSEYLRVQSVRRNVAKRKTTEPNEAVSAVA
jgi:hypothetical protein